MRALGRVQGSVARPNVYRAQRRARMAVAATAATEKQLSLPRQGHMMISKTEVPSFIQRDDMMDQLYRWAIIEAGEGGLRNFGMPMKVQPLYHHETLWGFDVEIIKEGRKMADLGINFDGEISLKHEWVGKDQDGFPTMEGNAEEVPGKYIEIWKLDPVKVDEDTRSTIRAFCSGLGMALNKYYAFGSVFSEDI